MSLIDLPQSKWGSGTGRQVILKSDFDKIEQALLEVFQLSGRPALEYLDDATIRVNATADCKARVMMCGFPSPLTRGQWLGGGFSDGRYRENAAPVSLNFTAPGSLWGTKKASQWYAIYALAGGNDSIFSLRAMPVMRISSQNGQAISLSSNANSGNIGYGFALNELAGAQMLVLSGASRGLCRVLTANNDDNASGGAITYGGASLTLAPGDWFILLPATNFRYLGMVLNGSNNKLAPFYQEAGQMVFRSPQALVSAAINGYTLMDLGLVVPPTAYWVEGFVTAANGSDVKLAISYDGSTPALIVHGTAPASAFQGVRGALPFASRILDGSHLYLNNENTANQTVKITGWRE